MFGYIKPEKPELKICEYETFRAYYCSVCRAMGKGCGQLSRLLLSYDAAFLAVLLSSLGDERDKPRLIRCPLHPLRKRPVMESDGEAIGYAADANVVLAYYNLKDNVLDEGSLKAGAAASALRPFARKACRRQPAIVNAAEEMLKEQDRLEKEHCDSMDMAADPFAKLTGAIFTGKPELAGGKNIEALGWLGYNIGKWLYIIDAYDDIEKDIKSGSYNPFISMFKGKIPDAEGIKNKVRDRVEFNLAYALNEAEQSLEFLKINKNKGIIENIIYMGMLRKTEQILGTGSCSGIEKSL